jgi:hypothetical protein
MYYFAGHDKLMEYLKPCGGEHLEVSGWCGGEHFAATLPPSPSCNVPRVPFAALLLEGATLPTQPTLYTNVSSAAAMSERWHRDSLLHDDERKNTKVKAGDPWFLTQELYSGVAHSKVATMSIQEHVRNMRITPNKVPQYVFTSVENMPNATEHFLSDDVQLPSLLKGTLWTKLTLALGSSGTGMPFHDHDQAWLVLWHGKKRWFIFDSRNGLKLEKKTSNVDFVKKHYLSKSFQRFWSEGGWECTQEENELMFLPTHFIHAVINIGETIAMVGERCPNSEMRTETQRVCELDWPEDIGRRMPAQKLRDGGKRV